MGLLHRLERRLSRYAIPNLTLFLVLGQAASWLVLQAQPDLIARLVFVPALVAQGEVWRILTFLFLPPATNPLFLFFALYFLYFMGTAMESYWGTFRYNLYLLVGAVASMAAACIYPYSAATNLFIAGSVFLAFAYLYPNFQILLFFILPIRIKWLALITWLGYGYVMIVGSGMERVLVLASVANFLLFFGSELVARIRSGNRQMIEGAKTLAERDKPFHVCAVCGITDKTHPKMEFRYCPQCAGSPGYCMDHIHNHTHLTASRPAPAVTE